MKIYTILSFVLLLSLLAGCQNTIEDNSTAPIDDGVESPTQDDDSPSIILTRQDILNRDARAAGYYAKPLAGDKAYYLEFNMLDYNNAIDAGKIVLLNFYSTNCTPCEDDNDAAIAAFDRLEYTDVVGFRVLFNDAAVTKDDRDIALKYGVQNVNTKVIVRDGRRVFKGTESWTTEDFVAEIGRNR